MCTSAGCPGRVGPHLPEKNVCAVCFNPGNGTWGPAERGREGCRGVVFPNRQERERWPVSVRAVSLPHPPHHRQAVAGATAPSPVSRLPSPWVTRLREGAGSARVGVCRQGGALPPSGTGLGATAMSRETRLVTPTSKEPKVGVSHSCERQAWSEAHVDWTGQLPGCPGPEGTRAPWQGDHPECRTPGQRSWRSRGHTFRQTVPVSNA